MREKKSERYKTLYISASMCPMFNFYMTDGKSIEFGGDCRKPHQNWSICSGAVMLYKEAFKNELGKMVFNRCFPTRSDLSQYHILIISCLNSKYHIRKLDARKGSFEWRPTNFCHLNHLKLRDHWRCVFKMGMQTPTYPSMVSNRYNISHQK